MVLWFRDDDGDLTDALVDATTYIEEGGAIWLLTPKTGRDGYVEPSDISKPRDRRSVPDQERQRRARTGAGSRLVDAEGREVEALSQ